ncbi:GNAT family N-acetyltransferase [Kangiella koreensis]|uniref:Aerobactin siderophore biosynthesis protein IucB n=1 Tax=Kangiella koreensis (strain DSM 16069 / JCM 12317 / KCTC 12182 / SW-125) TaxID=523791 RepID=C7R6Z6_KANKD|nr:GNAT family N-acetyltransferase [Kangiella koreensis]ACV27452.1 aerobactin siderophore biosynthesis protein IucB [Kangiella koreensis DSM 16069]
MNTMNNTAEHIEKPFKSYLNEWLYEYTDGKTANTFKLKKLTIEEHLDLFYQWHNQPYVYEFWELNQTKDELKQYLQKLETEPQVEPVIGYINDEPCAYFEIYWAYYDRIAPYCDATLYDRGYHLLIGNKRYLGMNNTILWLNLVNDFIFKDDPRTQRIVGEPRADNVGILKYLEHTPFEKIKEFDFPHKRAALLVCERGQFYKEVNL